MQVPSLNENIAKPVATNKHKIIHTKQLHQLAAVETINDWVNEITAGIEDLNKRKTDVLFTQQVTDGVVVKQTSPSYVFAKLHSTKSQWRQVEKSGVPEYMLPATEDAYFPKDVHLLENIKLIHVSRHEPFINEKLWQWLDQMPDVKDTTLIITTNGAIDPTQFKDTIDRFGHRAFTIRISGHGAVNDYINAGTEFNDVVMNIKKFRKFWPNEVTVKVEVQASNVLRLGKLVDWLYAEDIKPTLELLETPPPFQIQAIPTYLRQESIEDISKVMLNRKDNDIQYHMLLTKMQILPYNKKLHEKFILNIKRLDATRKTKFFQLVPELKLDRSWEK